MLREFDPSFAPGRARRERRRRSPLLHRPIPSNVISNHHDQNIAVSVPNSSVVYHLSPTLNVFFQSKIENAKFSFHPTVFPTRSALLPRNYDQHTLSAAATRHP